MTPNEAKMREALRKAGWQRLDAGIFALACDTIHFGPGGWRHYAGTRRLVVAEGKDAVDLQVHLQQNP